MRGNLGRSLVALAVLVGCGLVAAEARAEKAWVRGEVRLNVRTGPGTQYRIVEMVTTGDAVDVMQHAADWTQVQLASGAQGWIPAGYLEPQPPPTIRLAELEKEVTDLRQRLSDVSDKAAQLTSENASLTSRHGEQRAELDRLLDENRKLKAGARWPYLITGAVILATGMMVGGVASRMSARRQTRRIRL